MFLLCIKNNIISSNAKSDIMEVKMSDVIIPVVNLLGVP